MSDHDFDVYVQASNAALRQVAVELRLARPCTAYDRRLAAQVDLLAARREVLLQLIG